MAAPQTKSLRTSDFGAALKADREQTREELHKSLSATSKERIVNALAGWKERSSILRKSALGVTNGRRHHCRKPGYYLFEGSSPALAVTHVARASKGKFLASSLVTDYTALAPAVTYAAPAQQLPDTHSITAVTTSINLDTTV